MHMHQASERPDWDSVPSGKRNPWQRLAAKTRGIITPGNVISAAGCCVVLGGLWMIVQHYFWVGAVLIIVGRLADLVDGIVAEYTGTKSPLGRAVDATVDKLLVLAAFVVLTGEGVLPVWATVALVLQQLCTVLISVDAVWRRIRINPSRAGKIAAFIFWVALLVFVIARLLAVSSAVSWYGPTFALASLLTFSALGLGMYATIGYAFRWFGASKKGGPDV